MKQRGGAYLVGGALGFLALAGCSVAYIAPVLPSAYTERIDAPYDAVWRALVRALAREDVQIRAIARDSGVIASEAVPTTIGLYADCGRFGDERVQGDAQVAFTIFVEAVSATQTVVQVNSSKSPMPCSFSVGSSGVSLYRSLVATPRQLILPERTCGIDVTGSANMI